LSGLVEFEVAHIALNGDEDAEAYKQSTDLIMSAVNRLANRERVDRTKKGLRKPKRTPYLVGEPPFVRFFDSTENEKDPFSTFLNHDQIRASEDAIMAYYRASNRNRKVSKTLLFVF
jgi:hypothetical protein